MPRTMTKAAIDYLKAFVAIDCVCYCFPRDASALATPRGCCQSGRRTFF
jgi:hypothetical protein